MLLTPAALLQLRALPSRVPESEFYPTPGAGRIEADTAAEPRKDFARIENLNAKRHCITFNATKNAHRVRPED
jgi:hypothetical protein